MREITEGTQYAPKGKLMRPWKWAALGFFAAALLAERWLPSGIAGAGKLAGLIVLANLAFHAFRILKNRFFWKVRNRIVGAFLFVGVLPLLLILGIVFLGGYLIFGQLGTHLLETSLRQYMHELSSIASETAAGQGSLDSAEGFLGRARSVAQLHRNEYPDLEVTLFQKGAAGTLVRQASTRPQAGQGAPDIPGWLEKSGSFEGMTSSAKEVRLTSLLPVAEGKGKILVSAPLDERLSERLAKEKSIYAAFLGRGSTTVVEGSGGITIRIGESDGKKEERIAADELEGLGKLRAGETRRMVSMAAPLDCLDFATGEKRPAAFAVFSIPFRVLFDTYLSGSYNLGAAMVRVMMILALFFLAAELVSVLIGAAITRRITRSVHDMHQGMLALRQGNLEHRIPERRDDQLGFLTRSFNEMSASIGKLLEEVSEKKRLEQELEIAREVQATLFPKQLPQPPGLAVYGGCEPARTVSGDYYDFIHEDDARLHIVVGDISGKGISAALLMANLQAAIRNQFESFRGTGAEGIESRLATVIGQLNNQIYQNSPTEKYATLFSGRYDAETRRLTYCNAGHLAPIILHNGTIVRLTAGGTVLGLLPGMTYQAESVELAPGSLFAVFTDGVTEAMNAGGEEFGEERLLELLRKPAAQHPEAVYRKVLEELRAWQGEAKQHDDITLIVGKVS